MKKPVFRILVNTPSALGAVGYTTGLAPAFTLGCGTWGGSSTSDNITPLHLINRKRLAYGIKEYHCSPAPSMTCNNNSGEISAAEIAGIVKKVLAELK